MLKRKSGLADWMTVMKLSPGSDLFRDLQTLALEWESASEPFKPTLFLESNGKTGKLEDRSIRRGVYAERDMQLSTSSMEPNSARMNC